MITASPLLQFPWPLIVGAGLGLVLGAGAGWWGLRRRSGAAAAVAWGAIALTSASAGAFLATAWLWTGPGVRPFTCLYSCDAMQFLSTEQLRQLMFMSGLARTLTVIVPVSGLVAAWAWRRAPGPDGRGSASVE